MALTTSSNLDLTSKLKLSEGEIDSYKKLLIDLQNQISEMKVKSLNNEVNNRNNKSTKLN